MTKNTTLTDLFVEIINNVYLIKAAHGALRGTEMMETFFFPTGGSHSAHTRAFAHASGSVVFLCKQFSPPTQLP